MIVITAATGNIGSKLTEKLLSKGRKVRVIGRSAQKLEAFKKKGAETFVGDAASGSDMARAFKGAEAVFALVPPKYDEPDMTKHYDAVGEAYVSAIRQSGVKQVVFLSSVGAHMKDKNGPIAGLHRQEERLNKLSGVNVLHLRPGYFMENLFWSVPLIKQNGINGSSIRGDVAISMIATEDIAEAAAGHLVSGIKSGGARELLGERNVTLAEATAAIGKAIGKPDLKYIQFSYEDSEKAMLGMGMGATTAKLMNEMNRGFNEGLILPLEQRNKENTTRTSIESFAKVFANAYNN